MKKTIFKTFVCSFAISMLAIFSIGKLPSYLPRKETRGDQIKISGKNITLFVKKEEKPAAISLASVDKEVLPDIQKDAEYEEEAEKLYAELNPDTDDETLYISEMDLAKNESIEDLDLTEIDIDEDIPADDILIADNLAEESKSAFSILSDEEFEARMKMAVLENMTAKKNPQNETPTAKTAAADEAAPDIAADEEKEEIKIAESADTLLPIQRSRSRKHNENIQISTEAGGNQVAMADSNAPIQSLMIGETAQQALSKAEETTSQRQSTTEEKDDNPWVIAERANKHPTNTMTLGNSLGNANAEEKKNVEEVLSSQTQTKNHSGEVKVAEMVRNILIPIPEDILKEDNLTPHLISSKRNKDLQEKIEQTMRDKKEKEETSVQTRTDSEKSDNTEEAGAGIEKKGKKTIFDSISSIFSGKTPIVGVSKVEDSEYDHRNSVYVKKSKKTKKDYKVTKILPTEIKLSFQPNRAEISGQTLKWIEAFANKTKEDKTVALEIRIDGTSSFELQQKRLGLLHNILTNKGVEYNKINTVFTTREPNSFIIRTVRLSDKNVATTSPQSIESNSKNYLSW